MASNFPTSLDTLTNPSGADTLDSPDHSTQHANANDILEAIEAKVGIDSSAVNASHDRKLSNVTGSDKATSVTGAETLLNKTLFTPIIDSALILTQMDFNGKELILDADSDTSIHADTDDQIDIRIAGADDFKFTANLLAALPGSAIRTPSATAFKSRNNADGADIDLIAANSSDQTTLGQNSVRATRFVPLTNRVILTSTPQTSFTDLDITSDTSATTYAVNLALNITGNSIGNALQVRPNGSTDGGGHLQVSAYSTSQSNKTVGVVGCDTSQIVEYVNTHASDVIGVTLVGYHEYVD